ncbi:c-type cytochrome [Herbaspirillum sp. HC18]|nr:c-type cytochrome [Herbaspirillum sp. HC18]
MEMTAMHKNMVPAIARRKAQLATGMVLLASCLAVGTVEAQTRTEKWKSHVSPSTPDLIYRQHCAICHGDKGDAKTLAAYALEPTPRDFTSPKAREELSRAHMIEVLNKGTVTKEGKRTPMVAWKEHLSREQIEAVVDYIIVTFMDGKAAPSDAAHSKDPRHKGHDHGHVKAVDYPYGLKADATRGNAIYGANCTSCHGNNGNGQGSASKARSFNDADFRAFANGFSLFSAVSRGPGHTPTWEKKLSNQEIADVSEYVLRSFVKPSQQPSQSHEHAHEHSHDHSH